MNSVPLRQVSAQQSNRLIVTALSRYFNWKDEKKSLDANPLCSV